MERIILDVDSAGDDILAVLFAAANPNVRLEGVTTVTGAAGPIEQVTNVVLNTLTLAGRDDIPVHAGAWRPIVGNSKADMVWNRRVTSLKEATSKKYPGKDIKILPRPPELVDIANIRIDTPNPIVILHPGPPLSRPEDKMIRAIGGDLEFCAPSDLGVPL